jgi:hypothetical protein
MTAFGSGFCFSASFTLASFLPLATGGAKHTSRAGATDDLIFGTWLNPKAFLGASEHHWNSTPL